MPDNTFQQLKLDIARATEEAFRKEGMKLRLRQGFGDRIEGGEVAKDLAISAATNLIFENVGRTLRRRGVHVWGLTEQRGESNVDFVFHVSGSPQNIRLGLMFTARF
jgi:hypothetical protein